MTGAASLHRLASFGHDPGAVRELARELLDGSPFRDHEPSITEQLLERAGVVLGELLGRFLAAVSGDTAVAWGIVIVGTILLLIAVWRWTRGLRVSGGVEVEVPDLRGRSSADWGRASEEAAAAQDLERALRLRYLAIVAALVERGVLQDVPGRTIRELDAELGRSRPDLSTTVAAAGARVERVVYGGAPAAPDDLQIADAALHQVTAARTVEA